VRSAQAQFAASECSEHPLPQVASGAVIGGLVAGPFGALVGGWLGQGTGLSKKAEEEELARVGCDPCPTLASISQRPQPAIPDGVSRPSSPFALVSEGRRTRPCRLTREDAMAMRELVMDLQGLEDSLASLRQTAAEVGERVRSLGEQAEALHAQARECLEQDNEDGARKKLEERQRVLQLLSSAEEQEIEVRELLARVLRGAGRRGARVGPSG